MPTDEQSLILAVDDEPRNLRILGELFEGDYRLLLASSGTAGLELLESSTPDLILLDIMMPDISGYEVCRRIRTDPRFQLTKVILVSGKSMTEDRLKGYEVGANDYVTKPFSPEELRAKVDVYVKLSETEKKLRALNADLEEKVRVRSEQLLHTERAAYLGMHAAEIVHNLKSPLTVLFASFEALAMTVPEPPHIARAQRALERLRDTVSSILSSVRSDVDNSETPFDFNKVIRSELKLLEADRFFKEKVTLKLELEPLPLLEGRASRANQTVANLLRNAVDALHDRPIRELRVQTHAEGDSVVLTISDTGCGIAPEHLEKVFDPFFSTKPISDLVTGEPTGTGLGLPYVKRMVELRGGTIHIESKPNVGTSVTLKLPVRRKASADA